MLAWLSSVTIQSPQSGELQRILLSVCFQALHHLSNSFGCDGWNENKPRYMSMEL